MKKICLTLIGIYIMFIGAFAQKATRPDTVYEVKPLHLDEINLVSSYYKQEGIHSAVTGGIGNEHVVDLSNGLDVKFVGWDARHNKHSLDLGLGFDHHTSASSAYVSKSGASKTDGTRIYPSVEYTVENVRGNSFGFGAYYSTEYNYKSVGLDLHAGRKLGTNTEIDGKISGFFDKVKMIYPSELIPAPTIVSPSTYTTASGRTITIDGQSSKDNIPSSPRNTYSASLTLSQIVNTRMQFSVMLDMVAQNGYLGLPFHRVYFADGSVHVENLPETRKKLPIGVRLNYFLGDKVVLRSYYRYYMDDWGLRAHTAELEIPVKVTSFFSIAPFYRYYTQTAIKYFGAYGTHTANDQYYSSNYSLSALTSQFVGAGIHLAPPKGILNQHFSALDARFGHYTQSTELYANVLSFAFTFK
ncbi:DUF3570 domain-containing protein [Chitinophagaceae bacterium 26-R-25]|nr:DUF3570 domain-containing protein [Chitinophagaceae bacterium 26-R-25]